MTPCAQILAGGVGLVLGILSGCMWRTRRVERGAVLKLREALQLCQAELECYRYALNEHAIVAVTALDGRILSTNDRFSLISGYSPDELIGKTHRVVGSGLTAPDVFESMWGTLARGEVWRGEICNRAKSGDLYWVQTTIVPLRDASGRVVRFMAIDADISARIQVERELEAAAARANAANQAKSAFLANMSHELRTPMNAIIGSAQLLEATDLGEEQREYSALIRSGGEALLSLINDVLDLSKIEAGRLEIEHLPFAPRALVEDTIDLSLPATLGRPIELICDVDPAMPARMIGDRNHLRQVLINLLGNAVKFTRCGTVTVRAETRPAADGERVDLIIAVADTGIGIPAEAHASIFEPFSQADVSTSRRYGGTGLGLAIVKRVIEGMNGQVAVDSEVGRGSTFTIRVPLVAVEEAAAPDSGRCRPARVLIVDGNDAPRAAIARLLRHAGHEVEEIAGGIDAERRLGRAAGPAADVVMIDARILEAADSRLAAILRGRGRSRRVPIIALCPFGWTASTALDIEPTARLRKPVKLAELESAIEAALECRGPQAADDTRGTPATRTGGASDAPRGSGARRDRTERWRALVVEDNPVNRLVAVRLLARLGGEAIAVSGGIEAIARCATDAFDIIFMDCQMPGLDGYETSRCLRSDESRSRPRTPIVALTANALGDNRQRCLDAGMDDYLAKPVRIEELGRVIDRWVAQRGAVRRLQTV